MLALAPIQAPEALGPASSLACRSYQIVGDYMEPHLRGGDFLIVAPCQRYLYEAVYLVDDGAGEHPVLAQRFNGRVRVSGYNKLYAAHEVSAERFNESVLGISIAEVRVQDRRYFRTAA